MRAKRLTVLAVAALLIVAFLFTGYGLAQTLTPQQQLGEKLYFDEALSDPDGQACASCHLPEVGFDDPDDNLPVSEGIHAGRFGDRNSPMSAYAMYAPTRYFDEGEGLYIGGQFWDSRATGGLLGDPLADQAIGPPLNQVEMANPDKETVLLDILNGPYAGEFEAVCGPVDLGDVDCIDAAYDCMGLAIASFERTALFGQFSSKYDYYLAMCLDAGGTEAECATGAGKVADKVGRKVFSSKEWDGFQLFMNDVNNNDGILDQGEGAMCILCHVADWTAEADYALPVVVPAWAPAGRVPPMFTDFTYDNLGVPKNWGNPFLYQSTEFNPDGPDYIDLGLGKVVGGEAEYGKFKVMTLRNIGMTKPYAHNGLFDRLKDITHFYNTRDALPDCAVVKNAKSGHNCWDAPEVPGTVNFDELGNLGLSDKDEDDLVKFMETLSDGWWTP